MIRAVTAALVLAAAAALTGGASGQPGGAQSRLSATNEYVVLYADGASLAKARRAVRAAGGTIVKENGAVGVATVSSESPSFLSNVAKQAALAGAARNTPIGEAGPAGAAPKKDDVEGVREEPQSTAGAQEDAGASAPNADPLAGLQWDMAMMGATVDGSYSVQPGRKGVLVGILDTGVDGTHPDIAPNFDGQLSRNFTTDIPLVDGPCEVPSCVDPANVDENGHGTHVAGIVGAALNGLGVAGVAPNVTLVNLRAGQDSGFFFLQPTVDALTYAADNGVDVVNMSYFIDPWLYNCAHNPADSPEEQLEQRTIVAATNRALDYAYSHNVTLIAALGNEHTDLGNPTIDTISPDFPPGTERTRTVDNSCVDMPTEGNNVLSIGSVGPSTIKADYSNYGLEQTTVTAPGGYFRDFLGTPKFRTPENEILSAYPLNVAIADGVLNPDGTPNTPFVVRDCHGTTCAYYQWIQGTSMASPHAVGVAALIVSQFGQSDGTHGGLTMNPHGVETILRATATDHPCPHPPLIDYTPVGRPAEFNALCVGTPELNSIWGDGIVNALAAVTSN